jgi:hypothetical protein
MSQVTSVTSIDQSSISLGDSATRDTSDTCRPEDFAGVCSDAAVTGSNLCERHLRGWALAVLDRRGWPRKRMADGKAVAGDDAWRPWLREASNQELLAVLTMLGETDAARRSA